MKKFLWIAFLSFCFSGVAAESDWNALFVKFSHHIRKNTVCQSKFTGEILKMFTGQKEAG